MVKRVCENGQEFDEQKMKKRGHPVRLILQLSYFKNDASLSRVFIYTYIYSKYDTRQVTWQDWKPLALMHVIKPVQLVIRSHPTQSTSFFSWERHQRFRASHKWHSPISSEQHLGALGWHPTSLLTEKKTRAIWKVVISQIPGEYAHRQGYPQYL